jgi:hypothetical protein
METGDEDGFATFLDCSSELAVNGHPAWNSEWTHSVEHGDITIPGRTRLVTVGFRTGVELCSCVATEEELL